MKKKKKGIYLFTTEMSYVFKKKVGIRFNQRLETFKQFFLRKVDYPSITFVTSDIINYLVPIIMYLKI